MLDPFLGKISQNDKMKIDIQRKNVNQKMHNSGDLIITFLKN